MTMQQLNTLTGMVKVQNIRNGKTGDAEKTMDGDAYTIIWDHDGSQSEISIATFRRWYKVIEIEQVQQQEEEQKMNTEETKVEEVETENQKVINEPNEEKAWEIICDVVGIKKPEVKEPEIINQPNEEKAWEIIWNVVKPQIANQVKEEVTVTPKEFYIKKVIKEGDFKTEIFQGTTADWSFVYRTRKGNWNKAEFTVNGKNLTKENNYYDSKYHIINYLKEELGIVIDKLK